MTARQFVLTSLYLNFYVNIFMWTSFPITLVLQILQKKPKIQTNNSSLDGKSSSNTLEICNEQDYVRAIK